MSLHDDIGLWNAAADAFEKGLTSGTDWRHDHVIGPAMFELLGDVADHDILDAGCGPGWMGTKLAQQGARVVGIDASEEMLARARRRAEVASAPMQILRGDLCAPLPLDDHSFDAVVANMVLMDIPTVDVALAEFRRVLRLSGCLVFSITHPSFFPWCWTRDDAGNKLWKPVDDYLTIRRDTNDFWGPTPHYHRPLSWYVDAVASAGFVIDALHEPVPDFERTAEREYVWRVPDFIVIRALPRQ
jgi:SAM-dependent methyltransferase